jgi:hypothetical protein
MKESLVRLAECLILSVQDINKFIAPKITILQVIICEELRKGSMLNSGNNEREQNWILLSPRVREASPTVTLGCPRCIRADQMFTF